MISGYHADLASEALGFNVIAFIHITLATHSPDNAKRFRTLVTGRRYPGGLFAHRRRGLSVEGRAARPENLSDIVNNVLMPHQSVAHVRSSIVLDRLKESSSCRSRSCVGNLAGRWPKSRDFRHSRPARDLR